MSSIRKHLSNIQDELDALTIDGHRSRADEYAASKEVEFAVHELRKVFERTQDIDDESHTPP